MNATLIRAGAKGSVKLILPNINVDLRPLPATVEADVIDPGKAVVLDKDKPIRRPTDPQLYELRIEVLSSERAAHPNLQVVVSGMGSLFALLDGSGRLIASPTLDVATEFAKSTKLLPDTLQFFLEARSFNASAQVSSPSPSLRVDFVDQGQTLNSVALPLFVGDLILVGDGETPSRLYIADIDDNQPTLADVKAAAGAVGVPVVAVPGAVCAGDTWVQDQFQLALSADDTNAVQSILVHLPRMRSNAQLVNAADNLSAFVDNHFPSRSIGVFKDLWETSVPVQVATAQGGTATLQLSIRDSNAVLSSLIPVIRMWQQIESAIAALRGTTAPAQPLAFFTTRQRLASELAVLKATSAKPEQKRDKDTLTMSLDQKLSAIDQTMPLAGRGVKLTIKSQTVEISEQGLNDLFQRLMDVHSTTNYGGNIEVTPASSSAPFGTVVTGVVADPDLRTLLTRLGSPTQTLAQPWVKVNTDWLSVGHIDEISCFMSPASSGVGSPLVLRASPKVALALLDAAKKAQDSGILVTRLFRGKKWRHEEDKSITDPLYPPGTYRFLATQYGKYDLSDFRTPVSSYPLGPSAYYDDRKYLFYLGGNAPTRQYAAHMSVQEVLDICRDTNQTIDDVLLAGKGKGAKQSDYPLLAGIPNDAFADLLQSGLDAVVAKEFSGATVIPLPVLFDRVDLFATSTTEAVTPDLVNLQQLGGTLLLPKPYGPRLRPSSAIAVLSPLLEDNKVFGLPSSIQKALLKLLTVTNLKSRQLDVTTHWTAPSESCLRYEPGSLNNQGCTDAVDNVSVVAEIFRDGFDEFTNPDRDYTKGDTPLMQPRRDYFTKNIDLVRQRILKSNPGAYSAQGYVNSNTWVRIVIPENTVDPFEMYTQLLLEALGFNVKWVDSWFYHVHAGGVHCATNVLRNIAPGVFSRRAAAVQNK